MTLREKKKEQSKLRSRVSVFWKIVVVSLVAFSFLCLVIIAALVLNNVKLSQFPIIGQKVAVIPVRGMITLDGCAVSIFGGGDCASVSAIKEDLRLADEDPTVKAIVLDINSGGGGVVPSRELSRAVKNVNKPVVACIRETGASGAYYVASAADHIVADRDSITGSIGVIMTIQHTYGLYEKLGLNVTVIKSGSVKDIGSPYREMTAGEEKELKDMIDKIYLDFIEDVAENRKLSVEYVRNISDGSLYLGSEAQDLGLVDTLGGMDDAIEIASEMGGISGKPSVQESKPRQVSILDYFSGN